MAEMQSESPHGHYSNNKNLIMEASEKIQYNNIAFRAGSMPFFGYQCRAHKGSGLLPCDSFGYDRRAKYEQTQDKVRSTWPLGWFKNFRAFIG